MDPTSTPSTEYEIHGGFAQDSIAEKYDELCRNYDDVYGSVGWPDPSHCAAKMIELGFTPESKVLDMGCGTGLVADELKKQSKAENALEIHGIDASDGMIEKATAKACYKSLTKLMLCNPEEYKSNHPELLNAFDYVSASGLLAEGHATNEVFDEMIASLKVGGYAIFTSRVEYMESLNYQKGIDERAASGKWEVVSITQHEKYSNAPKEAVGRFKPVQVNLIVCKKL